MTAKQPAGRPSLFVTRVLSCCVLVALAAGALYLGAGSAIRPGVSPKSASAARPQFVNASFSPNADASHQRVLKAYGRLPLAFDANQGQTDPQVKYLARGNGYTLFLTANKAVLSMSSISGSPLRDAMFRRYMGISRWRKVMQQRASHAHTKMAVLSMEMVGANPNPQIAGQNLLPGVTNYLIGNDPRKWRTKVSQYARVAYQGVYPGVDLAFHGEQRQLEFDFLVAPQADPAPIGLHFTGAKRMTLDESGNLQLTSAAGDVTMKKPVAYQENDGVRQPVEASFVMKGHGQIGLALGSYDRSRELVIDPVVVNYATYLGGTGEDEAFGIALDGSSPPNIYVTGETNSSSFPGASGGTNGGTFDVFVTELNNAGSQIVFTTLIGGSHDDVGLAIAVDKSSGNIFVAGGTESSDFPGNKGSSAQPTFGGGTCVGSSGNVPCADGFLVELDSTGINYVYSTFLGGSNFDVASAMVIDNGGNSYLGGETFSAGYPGATGSLNLGNNTFPGSSDGFVAKLNTGTTGSLAYFTYLGGSNSDSVSGIALDASGSNVFVTGNTVSTDFPFTAGAFQTKCGTDGQCNPVAGTPETDAFVTELDAAGHLPPTCSTPPCYSTYLGGSGGDVGIAIAAEQATNTAYVTGNTSSVTDFPTTPGSFEPSTPAGASRTAFVTQVKPDGSGLGYSSYLGGSGGESGQAIALDASDNAYVTGVTISTDFPTSGPAFQLALNGNSDAFVTEIDPTGATKIYSSYLGGSGDENLENNAPLGGAITVDANSVAYLAGVTTSASGLAKGTVVQPTFAGSGTCGTAPNTFPCPDAFVAQISAASGSNSPDFVITLTPQIESVTAGQSTPSIGVTINSVQTFSGNVTLSCTVPAAATGAGCTLGTTSPIPVAPGTVGTTTLTISTKANSSAKQAPTGNRRSGIFYAMWLPVAGLALFGAGFPSRRRKLFLLLVGCCVLAGLIVLPSCSSSSGGGGGGGGGTPPGTYNFVVTGTSSTAGPNTAIEQLTVH